jgi:excisionase family DNA binding protein
MTQHDGLVTVAQVAEEFHVTRPTVRQWARDNLLPSLRVGRLLRFEPAALAEFKRNGGKGFSDGWRRSREEQERRRKDREILRLDRERDSRRRGRGAHRSE